MEKPTPTQNNYPDQTHYPDRNIQSGQQPPEVKAQQQPPEVKAQQQPPEYEQQQRDFSSPLAQPPLTNPPPAHQAPPNQYAYGSQVPQQQNFQSVPIQSLQSQSAPVVCPSCGVRSMTVTTIESGGTTHAIAAIVCFVSCLGCTPYLISSLKDVHHQCGNCNMPLADFHRSGRTEVRCWQK